MRADVVGLNATQAKEFCIRLWLEVTLVGRVVWSDEHLGSAEQLNALKWLNEIQHRVWGAYSSFHPGALGQLLDQVVQHAEHAPELKSHLRVALDRALAAVTSA